MKPLTVAQYMPHGTKKLHTHIRRNIRGEIRRKSACSNRLNELYQAMADWPRNGGRKMVLAISALQSPYIPIYVVKCAGNRLVLTGLTSSTRP